MSDEQREPGFRELGLTQPLLQALTAVGYETPTPIQAQTIPLLMSGSDLLGQAQTGTGKTAAFALPVLARIDLQLGGPQALVLVPTRELAIQVAEAFQRYSAHLQGFHVLPIYGGQSYIPQIKGLKRGAHVIVGTPGRIMDHMKRGALKLDAVRFIVLDEGDEMLQMGFLDAIEWVLEQAPRERQIALFSATLPAQIRRIAHRHMREPAQVTIQNRASTAPKIRQRYWLVSGLHKLDALTRVLEAERFEAMLIFVRTKIETTELAERLEARGFNVAALHGDIPQQQRERTIARLKAGQVDIVVATDVAARGLDVERISHVVNFDIPYDSQTYIHRIGRTGRAGRSGEAILFVAPRERSMLRIIERAIKQPIEQMRLPSVADVNEQRIAKFKESVISSAQGGAGKLFQPLIEQIEREQNIPAVEIAAALAGLLQGSTPFLLTPKSGGPSEDSPADGLHHESASEHPSAAGGATAARARRSPRSSKSGVRFETFRIEVGHAHGVQPGNIVGAIANEADLDGQDIGHIDIREDYSLVDLPAGMPQETFDHLQAVRVRGSELRISRTDSRAAHSERAPHPGRGAHAPHRDGAAPRHSQAPKGRGKAARRYPPNPRRRAKP
jgi:ATP-dependent RNA helicase DeaD